MEKVKVFLFEPKFFNDPKPVLDFIKHAYVTVNKQDKEEEKDIEAIAYAVAAQTLSTKVVDPVSVAALRITEANLLNFVAHRKTDNVLGIKALNCIETVSPDILNDQLLYAFHFVKGKICLSNFLFKYHKENGLNASKISDYELLYQAKKHFSKLINGFFAEELNIDNDNTQEVILYYSQVLGHLSRYVESFYLLRHLENQTAKYKWNVALTKYVLLEAIKDKTCNSINPLVLIYLFQHAEKALKDSNLDKRNESQLNHTMQEITDILKKYEEETGTGFNDLINLQHKADNEFLKLNQYQKFVLSHNLSLNEHSLYCNCKQAAPDNLKIESTCKHTQIDWIKSFQMIIDHLKANFDGARQSYFRAIQKKVYKKTGIYYHDDSDIIVTPDIIELIDTFKKCFSILDKIASSFSNEFGLNNQNQGQNIHFHTYFRSVKNIINIAPNNLFMLALYSISQDLDKSSDYSEFYTYKDWRNAAEHDQLFIVKDQANIEVLHKKYPTIRFFVKKSEMNNKTLYLLHLCRSAIFTLTWLIRKASIEKHKELVAKAA